jgi:exopolysaccharide biosynthesis polyprenyl glycosylphosphotransferase
LETSGSRLSWRRKRGSPEGAAARSERAAARRGRPRLVLQKRQTPDADSTRSTRVEPLVVALTVAGFVIGAFSLVVSYVLREGNPLCAGGICPVADAYLSLLPFAGLVRAYFVVRRKPWEARRTRGFFDETGEAIRDAASGSATLIVFAFMFRYGFEDFAFSRLVFVYDWVIATLLTVVLACAVKLRLVRLRCRGGDPRHVVLVRDPETAETVESVVDRFPEMGYQIVARVDHDPDKTSIAAIKDELLEVVKKERVDELILLSNRLDRHELSELVSVAELSRIQMKAVPELFGLPPAKVTLDRMATLPVLRLLEEPLPGARRALKRSLDVAVAAAVVVLTAPLQLAIALSVRFSSDGPILVRQTRVGMDGRPFMFLKFRTMKVDSDPTQHQRYVEQLIRGAGEPTGSDTALFKLTDDPRVTRVGKFLRRYSLDELPQLYNVLAGDMSVVGPRPALPFEVEIYDDWHRRRLEVRPGMTGLWQVSGRSKIGFQDMCRLDIHYIEHWSLITDFLIILRTIPALLRSETG